MRPHHRWSWPLQHQKYNTALFGSGNSGWNRWCWWQQCKLVGSAKTSPCLQLLETRLKQNNWLRCIHSWRILLLMLSFSHNFEVHVYTSSCKRIHKHNIQQADVYYNCLRFCFLSNVNNFIYCLRGNTLFERTEGVAARRKYWMNAFNIYTTTYLI